MRHRNSAWNMACPWIHRAPVILLPRARGLSKSSVCVRRQVCVDACAQNWRRNHSHSLVCHSGPYLPWMNLSCLRSLEAT